MKRKTLPVAGTPGREKKVKTNTPKIYNRLIREVTLQRPLGPPKCNALFDTGANIFVLDNQWTAQFSLSYVEHYEPLRVFGFLGQQDHTAGNISKKISLPFWHPGASWGIVKISLHPEIPVRLFENKNYPF